MHRHPPGVGDEGAPVIGHHALDPDAASGVPGPGACQKAHGGRRQLIVEHLTIGDAGRIVDHRVQDLPADPPHARRAIPVNPMPDPPDPAQLLRIQVHQLARPLPLVAHPGRRGRETWQPGQPLPALLGHHRGDRQLQREGNAERAPPLPAQAPDLASLGARQALRHPVWPTRSVGQDPIPCLPPPHPLPESSPTQADPAGHGRQALSGDHPAHRQDSP